VQNRVVFALALSLAAIGSVAPPAAAQQVPDRPTLAATADTNDAAAYYSAGMAVLDHDPEGAAASFYWASRLNPNMAPAFYARRVAMLLEDHRRLLRYWQGDEGTVKSKEIKQIDSLYYHALTLDPFVPQSLDRNIFDAVLDEVSRNLERQTGESADQLRFELQQYMFDAPTDLRAWQAATDGRLAEALKLYDQAIGSASFKAPLRIDRANVFYQLGRMDSTLAELTAAADEMRKRDNKDLVYVYDSKALLEERIAVANLRMGKLDAAKEALGQSLQEDLSYSPAHIYLAFLAMQGKDTATALSEMDLAVQLRPDDPAMQFAYGAMLVNDGRLDDAEPHLREAMKLDGVYAAPHFMMAALLDRRGTAPAAAAEYTTFLNMAARGDAWRPAAEARIKALGAGTQNQPSGAGR
jgi:Tfp pilus assembly protein PilF